MSKRPGEEEYSVDEIIAEFKNTELKTPEGREADAPLFKEPSRPAVVAPPAKQPAPPPPAEKAEAEPVEKMALGESRVIDITSRVQRPAEPGRGPGKKEGRPGPEPVRREPPKEASRPERPRPPLPPEPPEDEEEERAPVRRFPLGRRNAQQEPPRVPGYPGEEDYEDYEYEEEPDRVPYDFLFEADPQDIPHNVANLGKKIRRLRVRSVLCLPLAALGVAVTLLPSLPVDIPEKFTFAAVPQLYFLALCTLLALSMLAAGDILLAGVYRLLRLRPTLDTAATLAALAALAHGVWCVVQKEGVMPYTCVAQLTLFFAVIAKRGRLLMLRRTYKAAILSASPTSVCTKDNQNERTMAYKTQNAGEPDLEAIAEPDAAMRFARFYAPLAIVAAVVLAVMASFGTGNPTTFLQCLAAITAMAAPAGLLLSTATPGVRITKKLFTSGTALLNHGAARELAWAEMAVLADPDVFPQGTVAISGMKIARNQSMEKVVASAAGALGAVGGGLGFAFADFAKQQYIFVPTPSKVEYYDTGGISAQIGQDSVLCGTASFLMRMGIHVSEGRSIKSGVFVAVNSTFAGVFALKYNAQPQCYSAFRVLRVGGVRPVLATKDFNVTPLMVEDKFDLKPGRTEFPAIGERVDLAAGDGQGKARPLALLSRNTMLSFCECVTAAHRLCRAERFNLACSSVAGALGLLLMYYLSSTGNLAAGNPINVLLYLVLWYIPVWLQSLLSSRY